MVETERREREQRECNGGNGNSVQDMPRSTGEIELTFSVWRLFRFNCVIVGQECTFAIQ